MKKLFAGFSLTLLLVPSLVLAQTTSSSNYSPQYIALLEQLVHLLEQELAALTSQTAASTTVPTNSVSAPMIATSSSPTGWVGAQVPLYLEGSGFTATGNIIHFGLFTTPAESSANSGDILPFFIPANVLPGDYQIYVTNANGQSGTADFTVTLSPSSSENPTCTLTTDKSSYTVGSPVLLSWTSTGATYSAFQIATSTEDMLTLPTNEVSGSGSQTVTASGVGDIPVTLIVSGSNGSATCGTTVVIAAAS